MLGKHLESIRSKEKESQKKILEAKAKASRIVDEAGEKGETRLEEVRNEMAERRRALLSDARKEAQKKRDEMKKENGNRISALQAAAKKNWDEALKIVLKTFRD